MHRRRAPPCRRHGLQRLVALRPRAEGCGGGRCPLRRRGRTCLRGRCGELRAEPRPSSARAAVPLGWSSMRERERDFRPIQPGLTSREGVRLYKTVSNSSNPNKRPVPGFGSCTVRGSPTQIFGKICSRTLLKGGFCHRPLKKIGLASTHSWNVTIYS